jgi:hypothetical protein
MPALCFLLGVALDLLMALPLLGSVAGGALLNPDSYMRLVRLQAILDAGAPINVVARTGSGFGTLVHWSHLLDSILILLALPLRVATDQGDALRWAGVALGPLGVGALCAALCWAFAPLSAPGWRWTTPVAACVAPPIAGYGLPGVVHHHILLALACVMTAGWMWRGLRAGAPAGMAAGAWAAFGMWLSPETMPFTLMSFGALGVAWLGSTHATTALAALRAAGIVLLALVVAIVVVDPPQGGLAVARIDRISIVYVVMAAACCAIGWLLAALDRRRLAAPRRAMLGAGGAVLLVGAWLACFPSVARGPDGLLTPEQTQAMFGVISEMLPVATWRDALDELGLGALAVIVAAACALRRPTLLGGYATLCGVVILLLGALHLRFATYGAALGAGALPVAIAALQARLAARPRGLALARVATLAIFLPMPLVAHLGDTARPGASALPACSIRAAAAMLAPYAGRMVLAQADETPELLYRTGVRTVGSLYHDDPAAFMLQRAAWRSRGAAQRAALDETGAAAILICPSARRSALVADLPPDTLLDQLARGEPPAWLEEAGRDGSGGVLYVPRP